MCDIVFHGEGDAFFIDTYHHSKEINRGFLCQPFCLFTIKAFAGDHKFRIYVSGQILNQAPFIPGDPNNPSVNLYNANAQGVGSFVIDNVVTNDDVNDNFNDYTILIGRLTSGNFAGALTVGTASNRVEFDDFTIEDGNTLEVCNLHSDGGVGQLQLGRKDGNATTPRILFNSSQLAASYNAKIEASGGNASAGSGSLNVDVVNSDGFTIRNQVVWNAGNIQFSSSNTPLYAVQRDGSGNFSAGTITANLTGSASLNVLKTGDTMTGSLNITGGSSTLTVAGTTNLNSTVNIANDLAVDTDTLFVDVSADEVGVNTSNPLATLDVLGDSGIYVRALANGVGAQIRFSDTAGTPSQIGTFRYKHQDGSIAGTPWNDGFEIYGSETLTGLKVYGDIVAERRLGVNNNSPSYTLDVAGNARFTTGAYIDSANDNSGAPIYFLGASSQRNFRIGNQIGHSNAFEITPSTNNGGQNWDSTPALYVRGDRRVAINTSAISGVDSESNTTRSYYLNVQGDMNINGQLFQNNSEFVTSRWTEASNNLDIYRLSRVGIKKQDPTYDLHVLGGVNIEGSTFSGGQNTSVLYANGVKQWIDSYGIFKANSNTVSENVTVPANVNCVSAGPITIANGYTVTINNSGNWAIV